MTVIDTSWCETEPIRFPGAVMPHGALLVLREQSGIVEAASESCAALLGLSAGSLLGQSVGAIFGPAAEAGMLTGPYDGAQALVHLSLNGKELRARCCTNEAGQVLVDIESAEHDFLAVQGTVYQRRKIFTGMRRLHDVAAIAQEAAELVRGMTGFDRVMLYRFDQSWNGEVLGEARADGVAPYLGLHFPASDIPKQARELFRSSGVRQIPDVSYVPSTLLARGDGRAIDLGRSSLRSVSPTHIEYLKNMEVRATLVGSLVVEGRLWGLVSCQHKSGPKYVGPSVRDAIAWLCEDIAALIEAAEIRRKRARENALALRRRQLVDVLRSADLRELMNQAHSAELMGVVGADGFALITGDTIQTAGHTPQPDRIRDLQRRRREREVSPTLFASSAVELDLGVAEAGDGVAGALFVSLRDGPDVTLVWFRKEQRISTSWGGDPERAALVHEDGRVSPRASFAQVKQEVRGQSLAWSPEELDSAAELGSLIEIEALREREAFARTVLNSNPQLLAILDRRGVMVSVNEAWKRFALANPDGTGTELAGLAYWSAPAAAQGRPGCAEATLALAGIKEVLGKTREHFTLDYPLDLANGCHWFRMNVYPMIAPGEGVVVAHEDITQAKRAEAEIERHRHHLEDLVGQRTRALTVAHEAAEATRLASAERQRIESEARMQSRKMEAVGTLAAGIAHDFNTILGSIVGFAEMTDDELPRDSVGSRNIAQILKSSFRARDLIARMLAFAREGPKEPEAVDVVVQVREALALLRATLRPSVQLSFQSGMDDAGTAATMLADPTQIQQIVMNLCVNAAHAMNDQGTIKVSIDPARNVEGAPPGRGSGICLTVAESGSGMAPAVLERIFDPFFTTKGPGEGTGLGLSVVYGVVTDLGGVIDVQSRVSGNDRGTQFRVFLPIEKQLEKELA